MTPHHNTPAQPSQPRIVGYDVARALAILGMILVNYKTVMAGANRSDAWLSSLLGMLDGRAVATFVILAGVGVSLISKQGRAQPDGAGIRRARITLLKRALFLFVIGLLFVPLWPADILHFYGIYIAVAACLLTATTRQLWGAAALLVTGFVALTIVWDYETGWNWQTLAYADFWTLPGMTRNLFFNGFHPVFPWLSFMLIGMWLGRQEVHTPAVRWRLFVGGAATAVIAETLSWVLTRVVRGELGVLFGTAPMPPMPLYMVAGTGTAIALIMLCLELTQRFPHARLIGPLTATGQMALTLYVAHVVGGLGLLEAIGRLENQSPLFITASAVAFFILAVLFAYGWQQRFRRGPLEWVMHRLI